jgi:hypothetical protein
LIGLTMPRGDPFFAYVTIPVSSAEITGGGHARTRLRGRIVVAWWRREASRSGFCAVLFTILKGSFWVPFMATMRQLGLKPDKHAANAAVAPWLDEGCERAHARDDSCI